MLIIATFVLSTTALADEPGIVASGYCGGEGDGTNLTWTLTEDGTLTINGEGKMADYLSYKNQSPWYDKKDKISSLKLDDNITAIGNYAFAYHNSLVGSLELPSKLESIGAGAFWQCNGITGELNLPNKLVNIGEGAFLNCSGLTGTLIIPDSVETIGASAFANCSGFRGDLVIPNSLEKIESSTFSGCGFDGTLSLGNGITEIGGNAFWECKNFKGEIVIPDTVKNIEWCAFFKCTGFSGNLIIPDSVEVIGDGAFSKCSGLNGKIVLGENLREIGLVAFEECLNLTGDVIIPEKVTFIGEGAFLNNGVKNYYFKGNSPNAMESEYSVPSFDPTEDTIYYPSDNSTWEIADGKWKGYTAVEWNMNGNEECEHVPAEAVKENEIKATDDKDGSYDSVVYCSLCGEELRRETVSVPATGNHASNNQGGYNSSVVISIGKTESEQNPNTGAFTPSGIITVIMGSFILSFYKKRK